MLPEQPLSLTTPRLCNDRIAHRPLLLCYDASSQVRAIQIIGPSQEVGGAARLTAGTAQVALPLPDPQLWISAQIAIRPQQELPIIPYRQ